MKNIVTYNDPLRPEGPFRAPNQYLDDPVYQEVVSKTVVTCVDAIVTVVGKTGLIYLARRVAKPAQGLWCLGGRVLFNSDSIGAALAQNIMRETGVTFEADRFKMIAANDLKWVNAAQGDFPTRSLSLLHHLEVSDGELIAMSQGLVATEYEKGYGLQPFDRTSLVAENAHQALIDAYDILWS